jgi:hypothetical protein
MRSWLRDSCLSEEAGRLFMAAKGIEMPRSVRKTAWVAVTAAALAGLAVAPAHAWDNTSVQLGICNHSRQRATDILVQGDNQNGVLVTEWQGQHIYIDPGQCVQTTDWWWHKGQIVDVSWDNNSNIMGCIIPSKTDDATIFCGFD